MSTGVYMSKFPASPRFKQLLHGELSGSVYLYPNFCVLRILAEAVGGMSRPVLTQPLKSGVEHSPYMAVHNTIAKGPCMLAVHVADVELCQPK